MKKSDPTFVLSDLNMSFDSRVFIYRFWLLAGSRWINPIAPPFGLAIITPGQIDAEVVFTRRDPNPHLTQRQNQALEMLGIPRLDQISCVLAGELIGKGRAVHKVGKLVMPAQQAEVSMCEVRGHYMEVQCFPDLISSTDFDALFRVTPEQWQQIAEELIAEFSEICSLGDHVRRLRSSEVLSTLVELIKAVQVYQESKSA